MSSRTSTAFQPWALVLAGALAFTSNFLFTGEFLLRTLTVHGNLWDLRHSLASVCLVAAIVLAAVGFGAGRRTTGPVLAKGSSTWFRTSELRLWHFAPAAACYLGASIVYLNYAENPLVHVLWLVSIAAFLAPMVRRTELGGLLNLSLWEYSLVVGITGVAFALRYSDLMDLPRHLDIDVAIMGKYSQTMLAAGNARWIGMAPTDHQFSEHQFLVTSMRLFGDGQYGLVMLNVIVGTATVPLLYLVGRSFFNRWVGLIAACFLCSDYVSIHFSRILFGPIPTFFLVLAAALFARGIRRSSPLAFGLAGAAVGGCLMGYYSGRVAPVIFSGLFISWFFQHKKYPQIPFSFWLIGLAGILVVFGPNLAYSLRFTELFSGRTSQVVLWSGIGWEHALSQVGPNPTAYRVILEQTRHALLAPFYYPDRSTICYLPQPMLGVLGGVALALGLGYCVRRVREFGALFALLSVGLTFLLGGILTTNPPFWPHLNIASPALALIGAVGLEACIRRVLAAEWRWTSVGVPALAVVAIAAAAANNWDTYTAFARKYVSSPTLAARQIRQLPQDFNVVLVSSVFKWTDPLFQFMQTGIEGRAIDSSEEPGAISLGNNRTAFYVFAEPNQQKWIDYLSLKFPGATKQAVRDSWGAPAYTVFKIKPDGWVGPRRAPSKIDREILSTLGGKMLAVIGFGTAALGCVIFRREQRKFTAGRALPFPAAFPAVVRVVRSDYPSGIPNYPRARAGWGNGEVEQGERENERPATSPSYRSTPLAGTPRRFDEMGRREDRR